MTFIPRNAGWIQLPLVFIIIVFLVFGKGSPCSGGSRDSYVAVVLVSIPVVFLYLIVGLIGFLKPASQKWGDVVVEGSIAAFLILLLFINHEVIRATLIQGDDACSINLADGPIRWGPLFSGPYGAENIFIGIGYCIAPFIMVVMSLMLAWRWARAMQGGGPHEPSENSLMVSSLAKRGSLKVGDER